MPALPKITVVMPSLNQASFIEGAIQSVLGQTYPNLEFIVMDGGSTDGTLDILHKYRAELCYVSEPDGGQVDAINKGLRRATGDVAGYLNSDDLYEPGVLQAVGEYFAQHPSAYWLTGWCINIDRGGRIIRPRTRLYKNALLAVHSYTLLQIINYVSQPATFWRRDAMAAIGYFNDALKLAMDYDYWLRLGRTYPLHVIQRDLARFRIHPNSKSSSAIHRQFDEELEVAKRYCSPLTLGLHQLYHAFIIEIYKRTMHRDNGI